MIFDHPHNADFGTGRQLRAMSRYARAVSIHAPRIDPTGRLPTAPLNRAGVQPPSRWPNATGGGSQLRTGPGPTCAVFTNATVPTSPPAVARLYVGRCLRGRGV